MKLPAVPLIDRVSRRRRRSRAAWRAFTLIELMVALAVLGMILTLTAGIVSSTQKTLRGARARASQFREARRAFETLTRHLSQATVNAYWDYDDPSHPTAYLRQSDLHFVTGHAQDVIGAPDAYGHCIFYQAPFGFAGSDATGDVAGDDPYRNLETLLNGWGYYITWSNDDDAPPFIKERQGRGLISNKGGFRLMEFRQPSEELRVYRDKLRRTTSLSRSETYRWFRDAVQHDLGGDPPAGADERTSRVVAENVLALVIRPVISPAEAENNDLTGSDPWEIAPDYLYDSRQAQWGRENEVSMVSRNQVPPVLELTLVALDETSFRNFVKRNGEAAARTDLVNTLNGLFTDEAGDLNDDLDSLEERLDDLKVGYRVFQASVSIRTAKWSD